MPQQYLSTDPNASAAPAGTGEQRYLSTDPNAASPSPSPDTSAAQPEEHTVAGFIGNTVRSGANFVGHAAQGALQASGVVQSLLQGPISPSFSDTMRLAQSMPGRGPELAKNAAEYFTNRYGSMAQAGETLYEDPVGMAADVSTVATLGGGALSRAPGMVGRAGRALSAAGTAIDPAAVAVRSAGAVARPMARAADATSDVLRTAQGVPGGDISRAAIGHVMGDPTGGIATAIAGRALNSPAVRAGMATGIQGAGRGLTRSTQLAQASPETLTRLALLAQLQEGQE